MLSDYHLLQRSTLQMLMGGIDVWSGATLRKGSLRLTVHPSAILHAGPLSADCKVEATVLS